MMNHYVYKIINLCPPTEEMYYIGVHSNDNIPPDNDGYMGSSIYLSEAIKNQGINSFKKIILSKWSTRKEALVEEIRLHKKYNVELHRNYYNRANQTSDKFDTTGIKGPKDLIPVVDLRDGSTHRIHRSIVDGSEYYQSIHKGSTTIFDEHTRAYKRIPIEMYNGETMTHLNKGLINVYDSLSQKVKKVKVEDLKSDDNLSHINKNKVTVIELDTKKIIHVSKEDYYQFKDVKYKSITSGRKNSISKDLILVRNIHTNKLSKVTNEESKRDCYVGGRSKIIHIYDMHGNKIFCSYGNFQMFCKENNLPFNMLSKSYKTNGSKIFTNLGKKATSQYKNKGWLIYKGWYALVIA